MKFRPNIMFIQAEDTSRHHGCYGDDYGCTPNIDQFAREGCLFTQGISHAPVCAPSRSGMVTGMYPWTYGSHHMRSNLLEPPRLFTHELQDAGYEVHWHTKTDFNFVPPDDFALTEENWFETGKLPSGEKPFFVYQNLGVTHESRAWDWCEGKRMPPHEERIAEIPPEYVHDPDLAPVPPYLPDTPEVRMEIARHYDNLTHQDQSFGRAMNILEESGHADNTIVIYLSDHGRGLCREKRWCYEAGIHLPLIMKVPAGMKNPPFEPGSTDHQLVGWVDIAPTILSLCGVPIPEHYHGRVFLGDGVDSPDREFAFAARDRMGEAFDRVRSCRSRKYLYVRNDFPAIPHMQRLNYMENGLTTLALRMARAQGALNESQSEFMADEKPTEEFYDVAQDPHCIQNLASLEDFQGEVARHRDALEKLRTRLPDLGYTPEAELIHQGLLSDMLNKKFKLQIGKLPYQFQIGQGNTVGTEAEAIERYGPPAYR